MLIYNYYKIKELYKSPVKWFEEYCNKEHTQRHLQVYNTTREKTSFLLNPKDLVSSRVDEVYKNLYIKYSARRNAFDYKFKGNVYLDLRLFPECELNTPITYIKGNKLHFVFEEYVINRSK